MWKSILAGTAALAIAGTTLVYAQQATRPAHAHWRPSPEDRAAFTDARIAALKTGLKLTPDQEKLWPDFENALRDIAKQRLERRAARQNEPRPTDPVERLRRQAEAMTTAGAALKRLADAQAPLYATLDDAQKHRFQALSRLLTRQQVRFADRGRNHGWRGDRHHGRKGPQGPRDGQDTQRL